MKTENIKMGSRRSRLGKSFSPAVTAVFRMVLLISIGYVIIYPLIYMVSTSLVSRNGFFNSARVWIPEKVSPAFNYKTAWELLNYTTSLMATLKYEIVSALIEVAACAVTAYGFARFKFKGHKLLFGMAVLTLIIPPQIILLPLYIRFHFFGITNIFQFSGIFSGVDLINTYWPFLLLSGTALGFKNGLYIYLLRQHFKNMPMALEEAAYIDGCGPFRTFLRIMLPGSVPMLVTVFLFSFVWQWNDTVYSGIFFPEIPTLANKLYGMVFTTMGAGTTLMSAVLESPKFFLLITPIVILYLFTQKLFVQSISRSGIVG